MGAHPYSHLFSAHSSAQAAQLDLSLAKAKFRSKMRMQVLLGWVQIDNFGPPVIAVSLSTAKRWGLPHHSRHSPWSLVVLRHRILPLLFQPIHQMLAENQPKCSAITPTSSPENRNYSTASSLRTWSAGPMARRRWIFSPPAGPHFNVVRVTGSILEKSTPIGTQGTIHQWRDFDGHF